MQRVLLIRQAPSPACCQTTSTFWLTFVAVTATGGANAQHRVAQHGAAVPGDRGCGVWGTMCGAPPCPGGNPRLSAAWPLGLCTAWSSRLTSLLLALGLQLCNVTPMCSQAPTWVMEAPQAGGSLWRYHPRDNPARSSAQPAGTRLLPLRNLFLQPVISPASGRTITSAKKRDLFPEPADQLFL